MSVATATRPVPVNQSLSSLLVQSEPISELDRLRAENEQPRQACKVAAASLAIINATPMPPLVSTKVAQAVAPAQVALGAVLDSMSPGMANANMTRALMSVMAMRAGEGRDPSEVMVNALIGDVREEAAALGITSACRDCGGDMLLDSVKVSATHRNILRCRECGSIAPVPEVTQ
jgi:hypothetical protein